MPDWRILTGDTRECMATLPERSVHCVVTSPPYFGLRDYGTDPIEWPEVTFLPCHGYSVTVPAMSTSFGLEPTPEAFVGHMVLIFREVWRVLRDDGTLWLNLGDSYAGGGKGGNPADSPHQKQATNRGSLLHAGYHEGARQAGVIDRSWQKPPVGLKPKDLMGMPWRVAFALQADGWYLRQDIVWVKRNPMPESIRDRCTKAHEYIFLLTKRPRYFYDSQAVRQRAQTADPTDPSFRRNGKSNRRSKGVATPPGSTGHTNIDHRESEDGTRNARSWWDITSQPYAEAHFATYPEELAARCIKAGTSLRGCCPSCGAPWARVTAKVRRPTRPGEKTKVKVPGGWDEGEGAHGTIHRNGRTEATYRETAEVGNRDPQRHVTETKTTGWQPTCECDAGDPIPCTVLDPFGGSGTTVRAAIDLGRDGLMCELNPEYVELAERRITAPREARPSIVPAAGQMALFTEGDTNADS